MKKKLYACFVTVLLLTGRESIPATVALPDPYNLVQNWAVMPPGQALGELGSVSVDRKGDVWTLERCGDRTCAGSEGAPIVEFDTDGKLIRRFGAGLLIFPHSIYVDTKDNVWVADERAATKAELATSPNAQGKGCVIRKFDLEGHLLMTIGTPGVSGDPPNFLIRPLSVLVDRKGDIFVADGDPDDSNTNARILKFSKEGTFVKSWGKRGTATGEFNEPHSLAMDLQDRLFVADRNNNRLQIFSQDGRFLAEWKQFGNPTSVFIDANDRIYVSDTQSDERVNPGYSRGIRIGSARTGVVEAFIPAFGPEAKDHLGNVFAGAEGVAADAGGNVYAAESRARLLLKYAKQN
jgi:DNA-binding beta-propeller fold protein YncE